MTKEFLQLGVKGVVSIEDDIGQTVLHKTNSIHPQNMARIIARALANEANSSVYKLALGNGGTFIDATGEISFKRPNDGILPDAAGWQSMLHNQTYSIVVDENYVTAPPGSSVSSKFGSVAQVVVKCQLAGALPLAQVSSSIVPSSINGIFVFDELGLFTTGLPYASTQGYQDVSWLTPSGQPVVINSTTMTTLVPRAEPYRFSICVNPVDMSNMVYVPVDVSVPIGQFTSGFTYGDLVNTLNARLAASNLPLGVVAQITQPGVYTSGNLRFRSTETGNTSAVYIQHNTVDETDPSWLFYALTQSLSGVVIKPTLLPSTSGQMQGVDDNAADQSQERERLLTHLIFSPLQKDASRTWTITYTLTVSVLQSDSVV